MSGLPHPFEALPGKDYDLRGNEIVEATGGVMSDANLREAVQNLVAVFDDLEEKTGRQSGHWIERSRIDAIRAALAATADAPPEVTEEMVVAAVGAAKQYRDGARNVFVVSLDVLVFFRDVLQAALAAAHKEGK